MAGCLIVCPLVAALQRAAGERLGHCRHCNQFEQIAILMRTLHIDTKVQIQIQIQIQHTDKIGHCRPVSLVMYNSCGAVQLYHDIATISSQYYYNIIRISLQYHQKIIRISSQYYHNIITISSQYYYTIIRSQLAIAGQSVW